jgi:hypothetical protein
MNAPVQTRFILEWVGTVVLHNWLVLLWVVLGTASAVRAYHRPSRVALSFLYGFAGLAFLFEYRKHLMTYLAEPVDFLLIGGLQPWNQAGHVVVEQVVPGSLLVASLVLLVAGGLGWWHGRGEQRSKGAMVPEPATEAKPVPRRWWVAGLGVGAVVLSGHLLKSRSLGAEASKTVTVVSGLPRSGTSMMMQMLEAGGMAVLTDAIREADSDNPEGYYEFERVKMLPKGDHAWLAQAQGKAVKVIVALLEHLPPGYTYKVIFMRRRMEEVLASQRKMLVHRGEDPDKVSDEEMGRLFEGLLQRVETWLAGQPHVAVLNVDYNQLLSNPQPYIRQVNQFLGGWLDEVRMAGVVDPALYRNRPRQ